MDDVSRAPPALARIGRRGSLGSSMSGGSPVFTGKASAGIRWAAAISAAVFAAGLGVSRPAAAAPGDDAGYQATVVPFFRRHCAECHVGKKPEGDFSIAKKDLGLDFGDRVARGRWREVVNVLAGHEMPPAEKPQPDAADVANVIDWITARAAAAEAANRDTSVVLRRLNRAEYRNTIRDLVGVDVDVSGFPLDPPAGGFDNNGAALTISPVQIEQYLATAEQVVGRALVEGPRPETIRWRFDPEPDSGGDRKRLRLDPRNNPIVNGGNNPHESPWHVIHHDSWDKTINARDFRVPVAGTYVIRARVAGRRPSREAVVASAATILAERRDRQTAERPDREEHHRRQYDTDLAHFASDRMYDYGPPRLKLVLQLGSQPQTVAEFDVAGSPAEPQTVEFPVRFTTESAGVTLSYAYAIPAVLENFWMQGRDTFARPEALVDWVEIEGPLFDAWPPTSHTRILFPDPREETAPEAYARAVLERFMRAAWRRPVTADEVAAKLALFAAGDPTGSFVARIRPALVAVLTSPSFLYLAEPHADAAADLSPHELAARLSYFLWSSMPDAELSGLADSGRLADPQMLRREVDRLLADPRNDEFVRNFAGQWLSLREVGANPPARDLYPQYDRHLELSIVGESEAFFREFLRGDLDVRGMIKSDFVTINERLARFYGIPDVRGDSFRRVPVPSGVARGGIVTQASVLSVTSNGTRTSPVKRGTWILKTLLGTDPGLPVANAGEIAPKVPGIDKATVRQRLEIHRQLPQCARCHDRIDPLGFALENFNAAGEWRDREGFGYKGRVQPNDPPIDASARMPDGTAITGVAGLQEALLAREDLFLEALARKLTTYALGRELGLADEPAVKAAVKEMRGEGTTIRGLVQAIVAGESFRRK